MATHQSAIKRAKQNEKRRLRNRWHRGRMRTEVKKVTAAFEGDDRDAALAELKKAISVVAATASRGVIHKNTAARKIGRMTAAFHKKFGAQG